MPLPHFPLPLRKSTQNCRIKKKYNNLDDDKYSKLTMLSALKTINEAFWSVMLCK